MTRFRCVCVWIGERCSNIATQEDGFCDWCAPIGARTDEQLRANPKAIVSPLDGELFGIGGGGELHDAPLAERAGVKPSACWYPDSGRNIAAPTPWVPDWWDPCDDEAVNG